LIQSNPRCCFARQSPPSTRFVTGAGSGDLVAVHGVGGLGHLGIQFAARQGFRTVAVNRGGDKEALAKKLGASDDIDTATQDPAKALTAMGRREGDPRHRHQQ
jgi:D-arabinose 1-dehydrogenase-like Zn-dependent alcohol dehydrogenase